MAEGENVVVQYGYDRSSQIDLIGYGMNVAAKITFLTAPNKISIGENIYKSVTSQDTIRVRRAHKLESK